MLKEKRHLSFLQMDDAIDNISINGQYSNDSAMLVIHLQTRKYNSLFKIQSTEEIRTVEIRLFNLYRIP